MRSQTAGECAVSLEAGQSHKIDRLRLRATIRSQPEAASDVRQRRIFGTRSRDIWRDRLLYRWRFTIVANSLRIFLNFLILHCPFTDMWSVGVICYVLWVFLSRVFTFIGLTRTRRRRWEKNSFTLPKISWFIAHSRNIKKEKLNFFFLPPPPSITYIKYKFESSMRCARQFPVFPHKWKFSLDSFPLCSFLHAHQRVDVFVPKAQQRDVKPSLMSWSNTKQRELCTEEEKKGGELATCFFSLLHHWQFAAAFLFVSTFWLFFFFTWMLSIEGWE